MEQDYTVLLKKKKIEAAQATEAAQKLQQNVEELQVAAQKKDGEIGRLRAEAVGAKKYINETNTKSRSEGPALWEKSKNNSRRQMVDEDEQPETSQKRNCTSSLSNGLRRCSSRLQGKTSVSPAVQPVLFSPNFKVPKLKSPTPTWPEAASPPHCRLI